MRKEKKPTDILCSVVYLVVKVIVGVMYLKFASVYLSLLIS